MTLAFTWFWLLAAVALALRQVGKLLAAEKARKLDLTKRVPTHLPQPTFELIVPIINAADAELLGGLAIALAEQTYPHGTTRLNVVAFEPKRAFDLSALPSTIKLDWWVVPAPLPSHWPRQHQQTAMQTWCAQRLLASNCADWVGMLPPDAWLHAHALTYLSHKTLDADVLQPYVTVAPVQASPTWWETWHTLAERVNQRVNQASRYHTNQGLCVNQEVVFFRSHALERFLSLGLTSWLQLGLRLQSQGLQPVWVPHAIVVLPAQTHFASLLHTKAQQLKHHLHLAIRFCPLWAPWVPASSHKKTPSPWQVWQGLLQPSGVWVVLGAWLLTQLSPEAGWLVAAALLGGLKPAMARLSLKQSLRYGLGEIALRPMVWLMLPVLWVNETLANRQHPQSVKLGDAWRHQPTRMNDSIPAKRNELVADEDHHKATLFHLEEQASQAMHQAPLSEAPLSHSPMGDWADEPTKTAEPLSVTTTVQQAHLRYGQREVACELTLEDDANRVRVLLTYKTHTFESGWHSSASSAMAQLEELLAKRGFTLLMSQGQANV